MMPWQSSFNKGKRAFTLIEILVCVVLFSGLIVTVSTMYSFIRRTFVSVDGKAAACSSIELLLLRIDDELRSAKDVVVPSSYAQSSNLIFYNKDGDQISYELEKGKVTRTEFKNKTSRVVLEKADSLKFSRYSPGLVEILVSSHMVPVLTAVHVWNLP